MRSVKSAPARLSTSQGRMDHEDAFLFPITSSTAHSSVMAVVPGGLARHAVSGQR
jgi:hypothetical protein